MSRPLSISYIAITAALFFGMAACSPGGDVDPNPTPVYTADLEAVSERWKALSESDRGLVCEQARKEPKPDYRGMLNALTDTGLTQDEAASMLPYALNRCL